MFLVFHSSFHVRLAFDEIMLRKWTILPMARIFSIQQLNYYMGKGTIEHRQIVVVLLDDAVAHTLEPPALRGCKDGLTRENGMKHI